MIYVYDAVIKMREIEFGILLIPHNGILMP